MTPFRRPLGLALSGAGTLGAWQAGALGRLAEEGVRFDRLWGFSAGALNAAAWALGLLDEASELWRSMEPRRFLRLEPRNWPTALFSERPLREAIELWVDEREAPRRVRVPFHVVSLDVGDGLPFTASFEPGGRWDGPLVEKLLASCAIPRIFPPVRLRNGGPERVLVDGGVPGRRWLDLDPLAGCEEVLVLSVVRPGEGDGRAWNPLRYFDQRCRGLLNRQMSACAESTRGWRRPPALRWLVPERPITQGFLDFDRERARTNHAAGRRAAEALLRSSVGGMV